LSYTLVTGAPLPFERMNAGELIYIHRETSDRNTLAVDRKFHRS